MKKLIFALIWVIPLGLWSQEASDTVDYQLEDVVVSNPKVRRLNGATNTSLISSSELRRAACCNLGESFTTNPSVDVSYTDAATGARQIKLLGLSGAYVQMLTENIPNFRGAAAPYGLGYIAGPWMQSIQVSKGASSVKNGYESITGQINVEMKKPQADRQLAVNGYYDIMNKVEANVDGNLHFGDSWSAGLLTHFENGFSEHDSDGDGFTDLPRIRQFAVMPRVAYLGSHYVFQAAARYINERRLSGQTDHHHGSHGGMSIENPYKIEINTSRFEAFTKNAYMFDRDNDGNIALILSGSLHKQEATYGLRDADIDQREFYASLMYESKWNDIHAISAGLSFNYDYFRTSSLGAGIDPPRRIEHEAVPGAYAQYTLNLNDKLIAMAGLRYDYSDLYGSMVTPRAHLRYLPVDGLSLHASVGRGYRSPHPIVEYSYLLASSRELIIDSNLKQESAWNTGAGASYEFSPAGKKLSFSTEYYYTVFINSMVVDLDFNPHQAIISTRHKASRSHAVQAEISFEPISTLLLLAAWRYTDVKNDYGRGFMEAPLMPQHKGLFTAGFNPMMGKWQFDLSLAINGPGRMPNPYVMADGNLSWPERFKSYATLNAQITRNFRHWSVYIGGENLTNYTQPNAIIGADNPWGANFDATMIYGPLHGANAYIGFRYHFTKY